ncbi:MAG: peptide deformylase [Candidatus Cloacimonadota bacterium]|nr:MAG: peptide deformylase [Candidatus Cloacimonadota bacterium]
MKKKVEIVRTFPDSTLKIKTKNVESISESVIKTLDEMVKVAKMADAAGLAANQIGISRSLAVVLLENGDFLKMINPVLKESEGEEVDEEGCLSVPDSVIKIPRSTRVVVEYLDTDGNIKTFEASGFTARVLQHEIDHLNGLLIFDRLNPQERIKFLREYKK